jgi:hypothetical protein
MTTLSIAEAAAATGLSVHTLRYYERDGLLLASVEPVLARAGARPSSLDCHRLTSSALEG